jgi:hypothetical protein
MIQNYNCRLIIGLFHLIYKYEESTLNENNLKTNNTERNNFEKSNFKTNIFFKFERVCSRTWAPEGPDFGVLHVDHVDEVETWKTKLKTNSNDHFIDEFSVSSNR